MKEAKVSFVLQKTINMIKYYDIGDDIMPLNQNIDIIAIRIYPVIPALIKLERYYSDYSPKDQALITEEFFSFVSQFDELDNEDTEYYRKNMKKLFKQKEELSYVDGRGIIHYDYALNNWDSHFFEYAIRGIRNPRNGIRHNSRIHQVHTESFDENHPYDELDSSDYEEYANEKTRYVISKAREYEMYMDEFINQMGDDITIPNVKSKNDDLPNR